MDSESERHKKSLGDEYVGEQIWPDDGKITKEGLMIFTPF